MRGIRLHKLNQFDIFTIDVLCTDFPDLMIRDEDEVYCTPSNDGKNLLIIETDLDEINCLFRVFKRSFLYGNHAFTMIVSQTKDEKRNKVEEDEEIDKFLEKVLH
ncbi:hypothetical protein BC351_01000 [Paenibacillus ferrarius]|uniref:Uncharacterized protein n=1 Tax=Paenibacillus ferrarius TaxID=1469647 RepID=A0A1V4HSF2_9BACL|nr:hypothetical protein [Paenibacillus ferrarius]OPH61850.1 hypothetical protein BC351_01000 [Paenibacillus ferrarius]